MKLGGREVTEWIREGIAHLDEWEGDLGLAGPHGSLAVDGESVGEVWQRFLERMEGNYPFGSPRYAGQMLKPPHPAALAAYAVAMRINPNNHALDGGPPTSRMEKEVVERLRRDLFGFPEETLGHLTSSGTIANLEALWVAREVQEAKGIAVSEEAHYTHERMGRLLGVPVRKVAVEADGRMDLDALESLLDSGTVGTVVFTAGTTGRGAVDPIVEGLQLCRRYGARVHVDAAYGGFFRLLCGTDLLGEQTAEDLEGIAEADSVVVDPHKHGLQPYGCGCVLFRDPAVGAVYKHDSPYTYFTSDELHLGEISLECSRAGAAAAALWVTLELLPLEAERGLGAVMGACRGAALRAAEALEAHEELALFERPQLDIVTYYPARTTADQVDAASQQLFEQAMEAEEPIFVSVLKVPARRVDAAGGEEWVRILRSVFMKPEHEGVADGLIDELGTLSDTILSEPK